MSMAPASSLPPGPRLPMPAQTLLAVFSTERFAAHCRRRFDSMVSLKIAGLGDVVSVWDAELIKTVFTGDPEQWRAGEANARFLSAPAGRSSVLVLDGAPHLRMRRMVLPPFHGEAVRKYEELIAEATAAEVERWPVGEVFPIHPRMQAIALEVILRAVIGVRDERRLERLRPLLARVAGANLFAFWAEGAYPRVAASPIASRLPWLAARREVDRLLYEEIAAHRADPDGRDDVLALLMAAGAGAPSRSGDDAGEDASPASPASPSGLAPEGVQERPLSDEELRDQLATLLVAGHETTATALAWSFERLLRHPRCLRRLQEEIAAGDGEAYLEAVVNETLRVRPVIDQAVRKLASPVRLAGYTLPAGTVVAASILGVQMSESYDAPEEFRPERFLERSAPAYALIPFGGGVRRCVGASFAVMEMKTILRTVLERVELQAPSPRPERPIRWRRFTVSPSRGARVIVTARRPVPVPAGSPARS
jgi:cytochrome P450